MIRIIFRSRVGSLVALISLALVLFTGAANAQRKPDLQPSAEETSLKQFLQTLDKDKTTRYISAFRDLNSDGTPEAIVHLMGSKWCGSGGCNTLILARDHNSWKIITKMTITRPPIYVLPNKSKGWRSIGVWIGGGGIHPGHQVELRFDGKTYPRNPTVAPARPLKGKPTGEVVISAEQEAASLYDEK